jgi:hypothetical protein
MRTNFVLAMLAVVGSLLGACHKDQEQPPENVITRAPEADVQKPTAPGPAPSTEPTRTAAAQSPVLNDAAAPDPSADQQMQDDAEATGMTSHAARDTDPSSEPGNSQP